MRRSASHLVSSATFAAVTLALLTASGCPDDTDNDPEGNPFADGGTLTPPPPTDGGFSDAGEAIPVDAGPVNTVVVVEKVTAASGSVEGGYRVRVDGEGFTPNSRVFFGDNEVDATLTLGIQLPNAISVEVPPCDEAGPLTVRVVNELGIGELEGAFTCFAPITVQDIDPEVGSTEGGTLVTLTGVGFNDTMQVLLGARSVVGLTIDASGTSAAFRTPPGAPGKVDVVALDAFARSTLGYGFTYESPLALASVDPAIVDDDGAVVELLGSGFFDDEDALDATVGAQPAARDNLISEERLRVVVPLGLTGPQDITLTRGAQSATLEGALIVRPTATGVLALVGVLPARADIAGGSEHTLVGDGLSTTTEVRVGGTVAPHVVVDDRTVTFTAPAAVAGAALITLTRADTTSATLDGLVYARPVVVDTVAPAQGAVGGGTSVTLTGRGFTGASSVTFGGIEATNVTVVGDSQITLTAPAGAAGPVDVAVLRDDGERGALASAFRYQAVLSVLGVRPSRGGIGGGTFVTVAGTGFTNGFGAVVTFAGQPASEVVVLSDSVLTCRTPFTGAAGVADVDVTLTTGETSTAFDAFTFFNPTSIVGGARGGPIEGAVYVTAIDAMSGFPIPGMVAFIGTDGTPAAASLTDPFGQATISGPAVMGAQTVTVLGDGYSSATWVDINASELTVFLLPLTSAPPNPGPPPPIPPPATIRGRLFGFAKELFDPAALGPDEIALGVVVTTAASEFSGTPNPGADNIVYSDGGEFYIANSRPGRLALIGLAGIYNLGTGEFRLKQMGVRREVFPQLGVNLTDQDIELTISLDAEVDLSLPDAPLRFDRQNIGFNPTITRVVPFIQLGGEGSFAYTQAIDGDRNHALEEMPDLPGNMFTFVAGAYTTDGRNEIQVLGLGTATLVEGDRRVTGSGTNWDETDAFGSPLAEGAIFVVERPDGSRFASMVDVVLSSSEILLQDTATFTLSGTDFHIGNAGSPSSEVIQDGVGDLRGGITIQPVLGLPELISPLESGVLTDRTLRWRVAPGQPPSIHDMFIYEPFTLSCVWEVFVDGLRGKVIIPRVPELQAILDALPAVQRAFLDGNTDFVPPTDMPPAGYFWQHESIFVPAMSFDNWSYLEIGLRGRRAWTTDVHTFVKGNE